MLCESHLNKKKQKEQKGEKERKKKKSCMLFLRSQYFLEATEFDVLNRIVGRTIIQQSNQAVLCFFSKSNLKC